MRVDSFDDAQLALVDAFARKLEAVDGEEAQGQLLIEFVLERERLRRGVTDPGKNRDEVDRQTLSALADPDSLGPEHSLREGVMRRLVADPAGALRYLETALEQRSATQAARGGKPRPRGRDSITKAIEDILEEQPALSAKGVGRELAQHPDIQLLGGEFRSAVDAATLRETNLASRVSDARKRLSGQPG
jgi:hypothetical protein